jgi:hypothetical protein
MDGFPLTRIQLEYMRNHAGALIQEAIADSSDPDLLVLYEQMLRNEFDGVAPGEAFKAARILAAHSLAGELLRRREVDELEADCA